MLNLRRDKNVLRHSQNIIWVITRPIHNVVDSYYNLKCRRHYVSAYLQSWSHNFDHMSTYHRITYIPT